MKQNNKDILLYIMAIIAFSFIALEENTSAIMIVVCVWLLMIAAYLLFGEIKKLIHQAYKEK